MARPRHGSDFSISQLQSLLQARQSELDALSRERAKLLKQLTAVEDRLRKLGGGKGRVGRGYRGATATFTASGRASNVKSLVATLEEVLAKATKPMGVGDIVSAVEATGYRSTSDNFRAIVNQTLIKERKKFVNVGRGLYEMKK